MLVRCPFDIDLKKYGREYHFKAGDVVSATRFPEVWKAAELEKQRTDRGSPQDKMIRGVRTK